MKLPGVRYEFTEETVAPRPITQRESAFTGRRTRMFQELLSIAGTRGPSNLTVFLEVAAVIAGVGVVLWLVGARFRRAEGAVWGGGAGARVGETSPGDFPPAGHPRRAGA